MDPEISSPSTPEPNTKPALRTTADDTPVYRWTISQRSWGLSWPPTFIKGALHACSAFLSFVLPGIAWSWVQRFASAYGSYGRFSFGFWMRFTVDDVVEEVGCQWSFSKCFSSVSDATLTRFPYSASQAKAAQLHRPQRDQGRAILLLRAAAT